MNARIVHLSSLHSAWDSRIYGKECRSLAKAGYKVSLIVPHERDEVVDGVEIKGFARTRAGRLVRMTGTAWRLYREAMRLNGKIYHFHDTELIPIGLMLQVRGKQVVYDIHEDVPRVLLSRTYLPKWARRTIGWLVERIERMACRRFSALVAATPAIATRFEQISRRAVVVQNFPREEELGRPVGSAWSQRHDAVAYPGLIAHNRGIREMVDAMGMLSEKSGATLELAGWYDSGEIEKELSCLAGWKRVNVLGILDREEIALLLARVRAGLVLFHPEERFKVAYPIKMFEYMAAGIPVIASDFPLWRRIIEEAGCGLLVDPLNPIVIAEAIDFLLTHPEEAEAMGRRGREAVEQHYNWRTEEKKLLRLYADLVGSWAS